MSYPAEVRPCPVALCRAILLSDGTVRGCCQASFLATGHTPEGAAHVQELHGEFCLKPDNLTHAVLYAERAQVIEELIRPSE